MDESVVARELDRSLFGDGQLLVAECGDGASPSARGGEAAVVDAWAANAQTAASTTIAPLARANFIIKVLVWPSISCSYSPLRHLSVIGLTFINRGRFGV
jgi:hypothetical protein